MEQGQAGCRPETQSRRYRREEASGRTDIAIGRQASEARPRGESFDAQCQDESLNGKSVCSLYEEQIIGDQ